MSKKKLIVDTKNISQTFRKSEPLYKRLDDEALFSIKAELDKTDIKIHSIPSRIKTLESFLNKINLYQIEKPFEKINDIIGLRVICLFLADIEKIGDIVRNTFEVIKEDNKIDNSKFASFGYLSVHFIVKLGKSFSGTRYNDICEIPFEIQVRTIAMDAWANISHYLEYKTDKDIPDELKRDFYALSGMFYVADKHFQLFFEQRKENTEEIRELFEKGKETDINSQPINLDTLKLFLRDKLPNYPPENDVSLLVNSLNKAGFKTIGEINHIFEKGIKSGEAYFKDINYFNEDYPMVNNAALLTFILLINDFNFYVYFSEASINDFLDVNIKNSLQNSKGLYKEMWETTFGKYRIENL